ncbi:hypothetical protein [Erythrobacter longus]|nr:hypothetical protein [Erythrobacter longus]
MDEISRPTRIQCACPKRDWSTLAGQTFSKQLSPVPDAGRSGQAG